MTVEMSLGGATEEEPLKVAPETRTGYVGQ